MSNDTSNFQDKNPEDGAISSAKKIKNLPGGPEIKEYGKRSLAPLIDLLAKYKGEISPYFIALSTGLQGAVDALSKSTSTAGTGEENISEDAAASEAKLAVGGWFREANEWLEGAHNKLQSDNRNDLLDYLEQQAKRHPAMMFSSSYIAGLVFGRIGRHLGRQFKKTSSFESHDFGSDSLNH